MSDCPICLKNMKNIVKCPYCLYESCLSCVKIHILGNDVSTCMNCAKEWSKDFISENTSKSFYENEFRKHMTDVMYKIEMSLLPSTQYLVEREMKKRENDKLIKDLSKEKIMLRQRLEEIDIKIRSLKLETVGRGGEGEAEDKVFICPCPVDDCRGYLNDNWKCGLCDSKICRKCITLDSDEHKCDENIVESVKLIKKDTKPCPKCGTRIYKINGCNHMFCTAPNCNTGFCWESGKEIDDSKNTNPLFYEYKRRQGLDIERKCGGLPNPHIIQRKIKEIGYDNRVFGRDITEYGIIQALHHIREIELNKYRPSVRQDNVDLRIKYMLKEIDEKSFKSTIKKRQKKREKNTDIYNVLDFYSQTVIDSLLSISRLYKDKDVFKNHIREIYRIRKYSNECLSKIKNKYGGVVPEILNNWNVPERVRSRRRPDPDM